MSLARLEDGAHGVLPSQLIEEAIGAGYIDAGRFKITPESIQPASLDLRLGDTAYRIRCSFLPHDEPVERKLKDLIVDELDLRKEGAVLETNRPYLIPLAESLALPAYMRGKANPKSSTGRLDVFTRVISDNSYRFDEVAAGYSGPLYLEVVPLSFPIRVREGLALNQLRLMIGSAALDDHELWDAHERSPILLHQGIAVSRQHFATSSGLFLSLDLKGDEGGRVGYRAREHASLLDMSRVGSYDIDEYWEPVRREGRDRIVLDPERFYLLLSEESVCVPPTLACEMTAFDPTSGELRTHYAGFFDPGFGYDPAGELHGSRAALEVRAHDVPFMIEHGQRVCKLTFERMIAEPDRLYGQSLGSNYQGQVDTVGKHFRKPQTANVERLKPKLGDDPSTPSLFSEFDDRPA